MTTMISQKSMGPHNIGTHNFVVHNIQEQYNGSLTENEILTNRRHITNNFFNGSLISSNVAYHDLVCIQDLFVMGDCACVNHWNGVFYIKRRQTNEI